MLPARPLGRVQLPGAKNRALLWRAQRQGDSKGLRPLCPLVVHHSPLENFSFYTGSIRITGRQKHTLGSITGPPRGTRPSHFRCTALWGLVAQLMGFPGTTRQPCQPLHCTVKHRDLHPATRVASGRCTALKHSSFLHTLGCRPPGRHRAPLTYACGQAVMDQPLSEIQLDASTEPLSLTSFGEQLKERKS